MKHDCCIGLYHEVDNSFLITLDGLKREIEDTIYLNYLLEEYADRRKNTNLTRFSYCPYCGKQIDWAAMRKENKHHG